MNTILLNIGNLFSCLFAFSCSPSFVSDTSLFAVHIQATAHMFREFILRQYKAAEGTRQRIYRIIQ
jgi:hypothetical protein